MDLISSFIDNIEPTDLIYLVSGLFTFVAYMVTNMILLRSMIVAAACLSLTYGLLIGQTMFTVGQGLLIFLNLVQIGIILYNTKAFFLSEPWRTFYEKSFTAMTPREFMKMVKLAKTFETSGEQLCEQSKPHDRLIYLMKGEAEVIRDGEIFAIAQEGSFLGEMSYLTQEDQEADVIARGAIEYLCWDRQTLTRLKRKDAAMYTKMLNVLGVDLINKMRVQRDTIMSQQSMLPVAPDSP